MIAAVLTTAAVVALTPQQKAALVVVSGLPAPAGVGGVIVQRGDRDALRPPGALVFVDQEGGQVRAFPELPPAASAHGVRGKAQAYAAGRSTGRALRRAGAQVDLAPVLDLPDGPLGARQFRSPFFGVAFARGLARGGAGACAKHFPGLGTLPVSTDKQPYVRGRLRDADLAPYRAAIEAEVPCVMVGHGVYPSLGPRRAVVERSTYRLLRTTLGFRGITITDSLSVVHGRAAVWAPAAARAGADLLLVNNPAEAARAIAALVPLARSGALDVHVSRVLRFRRAFR
ncbi:MAG TPA: glycoside hydrolase family 3 N-terminal domain-containing protein [Gaiellaceae bacterium]|nr:glycoside hydrolase family 3 N-terminal domain-containing protein [Gaiellaceae bacterium]